MSTVIARPSTTPAKPTQSRLGVTSATAPVIGSIIGTGVFTMPAVMAGAGTASLVTLGVIAVGAGLLGVLFGQLTRRAPRSTVASTRTHVTSSATSRAT